MCLYTIFPFSQVESCLSAGFKGSLGLSVSSTVQSCSKVLDNHDSKTSDSSSFLSHHTKVVGGSGWPGKLSLNRNDSVGFHSWMRTLKNIPDIIYYSLRPLHLLIPNTVVQQGVKVGFGCWYISLKFISGPWSQFHSFFLSCPQIRAWLTPGTQVGEIIRYQTHTFF